eukprot:485716-Pyramimonas_sp.AAC.1
MAEDAPWCGDQHLPHVRSRAEVVQTLVHGELNAPLLRHVGDHVWSEGVALHAWGAQRNAHLPPPPLAPVPSYPSPIFPSISCFTSSLSPFD